MTASLFATALRCVAINRSISTRALFVGIEGDGEAMPGGVVGANIGAAAIVAAGLEAAGEGPLGVVNGTVFTAGVG